MTGEPDHYRILGVDPASEDVVIQAAYRALMRRYHPDTNRNSGSSKRAQEINAAYAVLSDPDRRRDYDHRRGARQGGSTPPPDNDQSPPASNPDLLVPMKNGVGVFLAYGAITVFLIGAAVLASLPNSGAEENTVNVDETLTTENIVGNATAADESIINVDETLTTENIVGNDTAAVDAAEDAAVTPSTLATQPMTPVRFEDVESAATRFAAILMGSGISGARAYSTKCHQDVAARPSWSAADYCAAFDYAAADIDRQIAVASKWTQSSYFKFQADNQQDHFLEAGAQPYSTTVRLLSIKQAAESSAKEAVQLALEKRRQKRLREEQTARDAEAVTNGMDDTGS